MSAKKLGFFTRLLDDGTAGERYSYALDQIVHAEQHGFDAAWVAQHHFDADEGGLPAPFVLLMAAAERTSHIRLGTGVITLPLENPIRVAEDAAVFDLISGGRLEFGIGTSSNPYAYAAFGLDVGDRGPVIQRSFATLLDALNGRKINGAESILYPAAPQLLERVWQATFGVEGGRRAGQVGDGVMLSRTQPRPADAPEAELWDIQNPIIDAYLEALAPGKAPRIMGSRSVIVADDPQEIRHHAQKGLDRFIRRLAAQGRPYPTGSLDDVLRGFDVHLGTPEQVIESLSRDTALARATEVAVQVHSVDPPHPLVLRSIELFGTIVAPALGWKAAPQAKVAA